MVLLKYVKLALSPNVILKSTFHYGSIKIINIQPLIVNLSNLHSTMVLLKSAINGKSPFLITYLHSTMVLLKFYVIYYLVY